MPLSHFGIKEPEKVCNNCKAVVDLVWKSQSDNPVSYKQLIELWKIKLQI